jgi:uncharacterized protein YfaS (alpha-2-macroglobulin family)
MNFRFALRFLLPALVCLVVFTFLVFRPSPPPVSGKQYPRAEFPDADAKPEIAYRLSEGSAPRPAPSAPAPVERLPESETERLLKDIPRNEAEIEAAKGAPEFAFPPASSPPPRTGKTVTTAFPPPVAAPRPAVTSDPKLNVTRFGPSGEIAEPKQIAVTFSQPMVPVADLDTLAEIKSPAELVPAVPGRWRWLGTRTLAFEPTGGAFPKATKYVVRIPAGTKSAVGGTLDRETTWTFSTPAPNVVAFTPQNDDVETDPLMFVRFDQKMDAAGLAKLLRATAGGAVVKLRPATAAEIAADEGMTERLELAGEGKGFVFRPAEPLPGGVKVVVTIPAGTPSAEGPRATLRPQSFDFRTAGPMRVVRTTGTGQSPESWSIEFTNPPDQATFTESQVTVEPSPGEMVVRPAWNKLLFQTTAKPRTTYTVKLSPEIRDIHGRKLGPTPPIVIRTGRRDQQFSAPNGGLTIPDPRSPSKIFVESVNYTRFRMTVRAVTVTDRSKFAQRYQVELLKTFLPGKIVADTVLPIVNTPDEPVLTPVDLAPYLPGSRGHLLVTIEPVGFIPRFPNDKPPVFTTWVTATDLGLDVVTDAKRMVVRATSLRTGQPLAGVKIAPGIHAAPVSMTGADGRVEFSLDEVAVGDPARLVASLGDDSLCLFSFDLDHPGRWDNPRMSGGTKWFIFDDRELYRPDEDVHLKGWLRAIVGGPTGDVSREAIPDGTVEYEVLDGQRNPIAKGKVTVDDSRGFDLAFRIPKTANIGYGSVRLVFSHKSATLPIISYDHSFRIEEFRRPEFEVTLAPEAGPFYLNEPTTVTARAAYLAGGGLPDTETKWVVSARAATFRPPNRDGFTFGEERRWWWIEDDSEDEEESDFGDSARRYNRYQPSVGRPKTFVGRTDGDGKHALKLDFDRFAPVRPALFTLSATVQDVNRQAFSATQTLLVHPSACYVGLRRKNGFVPAGEGAGVEVIVTDIAGKSVTGAPVRLRFARLTEKFINGTLKEIETDPTEMELVSTEAPQSVVFPARADGIYRVTAVTADEKGRPAVTRLRVWVGGGEAQKLTLVPDRKEYRAGETATITVSAPFENGTGLLTISRDGLVSSEIFTMRGKTATITLPVREEWTPNVVVSLLLNEPPGGDKTAFRSETAELNLKIPPRSRTLTVTAQPREKTVAPGGETTVDVTVTDAEGRAVPDGSVALVVVDESVLALTGYKLPNPVAFFHPKREANVTAGGMRDCVLNEAVIRNPWLSTTVGGGAGGGRRSSVSGLGLYSFGGLGMTGDVAPPPRSLQKAVTRSGSVAYDAESRTKYEDRKAPGLTIALRTDFNPLAHFSPTVKTDGSGRAVVKLKVPDNLTRYRVMAVAASGERSFGKFETDLTARLPLMARPSPPRFLNFGDRCELPVVVQNLEDQPQTVTVAIRATNAGLPEGGGRRVTVPAGDRVEVRFPVTTERVGKAAFVVRTASRASGDAAVVTIPVYTPATTEAFATYGELDAGATVQPIVLPRDAVNGFGSLDISTSATEVQSLTDAFLYEIDYPYACSEQLASQILTVAALGDVLREFKAEGVPAPEVLKRDTEARLTALLGRMRPDGGVKLWPGSRDIDPFVSAHVGHALAVAREAGLKAPQLETKIAANLNFLKNIEAHIPKEYGPRERREIGAYALYVRMKMGDRDPAKAARLAVGAGKTLSGETLGWLLAVMAEGNGAPAARAALRRVISNRMTETAGAAEFGDSTDEDGWRTFGSNRRAEGVVLDAVMRDESASDLIPKLVRGLLGHRVAGRWNSTQENVFILLALGRYFKTYEKETPGFTARAWVGERLASESAFLGRTTERRQTAIPFGMVPADAKDITLAKEGPGRMYYRIGMRYAPRNLMLAPLDAGFEVHRSYVGADDPADVTRDPDGTWRVRAGARVKVTVTMTAIARRVHVALSDPLPGGFEVLNPELRGTEPVPANEDEEVVRPLGFESRFFFGFGPWYDHLSLRDDRAEAFAARIGDGTYVLTYFARATTPGEFIVPPSKAEEMYHPETFGRGASARVVVK